MTRPFIPPYPPRQPRPVATWRGFFGERARTSVYGWSQLAFETDYLKRNILGFTVHILLDPDMVQHVLLDNPATYAKPDIVKSLLDPIIGRGPADFGWRTVARAAADCRSKLLSGRGRRAAWQVRRGGTVGDEQIGRTASGGTWRPSRPGRR